MTRITTALQKNKIHDEVIQQHNKGTLRSEPEDNLQSVNKVKIDPGMRLRMIEISAYFRAEKRGGAPGSDMEDWLISEQEVDRNLSSFSS